VPTWRSDHPYLDNKLDANQPNGENISPGCGSPAQHKQAVFRGAPDRYTYRVVKPASLRADIARFLRHPPLPTHLGAACRAWIFAWKSA